MLAGIKAQIQDFHHAVQTANILKLLAHDGGLDLKQVFLIFGVINRYHIQLSKKRRFIKILFFDSKDGSQADFE